MRRFRIYSETVDRTEPDGSQILRSRGCDGVAHMDSLARIVCEDGQVVWAEPVGEEDRGACDFSCGAQRLGEFISNPSLVLNRESITGFDDEYLIEPPIEESVPLEPEDIHWYSSKTYPQK